MMIDRPPPELFAQRPVRSDFSRGGVPYAVRRVITVVVLLSAIGGGAYWGLSSPSETLPEEIPTIKAEGSYKEKPEQPGGIDIPHQDVEVYQALDSSTPDKPEVERLLPPPEEPLAAPATPVTETPSTASLETLTPSEAKMETATTVNETKREFAVLPTIATTVTTPKEEKPAPIVKAKAVEKEKPPVKEVKAVEPKQTIGDVLKKVEASAKTGPVVQLASIPNETEAKAAAEQLQSKYKSILGSTKLRLVKADLGEKGIYYRVQSQPLTADNANKICSDLKNMKVGCIIVRR